MNNNTTTPAAPTHIHPWEAAGLGTAPFKLVGSHKLTFQACPGAPIQAGGTCDYCPAAISYAFVIRGADGKEFKVGSTCVEKVNAKGSKILTAVQKRVREMKREAAAVRATERRTALLVYLMTIEGRRALRAIPHPHRFGRNNDETMLNNVVWMLRASGQAGTLKTIRAVNKMCGTKL